MTDELSPRQREWLAVLSHELRSPVSAVLGYGELLADGTLGPLEQRAIDAVERVRQAAGQLLRIIEGIEQMADPAGASVDPVQTCSALELLTSAAAALKVDADARGTALHVHGDDVELVTRPEDVLRSLLLALSAAVKVSPRQTLRLHARAGNPAVLVIEGTRLDPVSDDPDASRQGDAARLSGAALRLALARHCALPVDGDVSLHGEPAGARLELTLPRLPEGAPPIDVSEDRP